MIPALVLLTCFYQTGCQETANAYYLSEPVLQERVGYLTTRIKQKVGERATLYIGSILNAGVGRDFTIPLSENVNLKANVKQLECALAYGWKF